MLNRDVVRPIEPWCSDEKGIQCPLAPRSARLFPYRVVVPLPLSDCFASADATTCQPKRGLFVNRWSDDYRRNP
jgi:hypothetical protein